jgi:hypothetical protein
MNIVYNIKLTALPVDSEEYPTTNLKADSQITVVTSDEYICIAGQYNIRDQITPISSYLSAGSTYTPKYVGDQIRLSTILTDPSVIPASTGLALIGQSTTSGIFQSLNTDIKKATLIKGNTYLLSDILPYNSAAMFFNVDSELVTLVDVNAFVNSNTITTTSYTGTVFYLVFNNSFKVDAQDSYCFSYKDINTLPFGFCNFTYKKPPVASIQLLTDMILLNTDAAVQLTSSSVTSFDGIITNTYNTTQKESIIIATTLDTTPVSELTSVINSDTLTLISYIEDDGSLTPYLLVAGDNYTQLVQSSTLTLAEFLAFDPEFKKRYVYNSYVVSFYQDSTLLGSIYNTQFYNNIFQNLSLYTNIITTHITPLG